MTFRKILAIMLCVCAVISVMAFSASAVVDPNRPPETPPPQSESEPEPEPEKSFGERIVDGWNSFMGWFKPLYESIFPQFSLALAKLVEWLLRLVGIGTWTLT